MKPLLIFLMAGYCHLLTYGQHRYPGPLEVRTYKIGDKVDTTLFKKYGRLYLPNRLDGWAKDTVKQLPEKYLGLPVAVWRMKRDTNMVFTLLENTILNIGVSNITKSEKETLSRMLTEKFGADGAFSSYEQEHASHPLTTYWNLKTWETGDVIFQLGNNDMRMPEDPAPSDLRWKLVYSDFILEDKVISEFRKSQ